MKSIDHATNSNDSAAAAAAVWITPITLTDVALIVAVAAESAADITITLPEYHPNRTVMFLVTPIMNSLVACVSRLLHRADIETFETVNETPRMIVVAVDSGNRHHGVRTHRT